MQFKLNILVQNFPYLFAGLKITLGLTFFAMFIGITLGLGLALLKISKNKLFKWLATIYIEGVRGTPLLLQILIVYFAFGYIIRLNAFTAGVVALSLNSAAYVSEIIRAGIESVPKGQMEAALSVGMNYSQSMRYIILPQMVRRVLPPITNEIVAMFKDTSLVMVMGLAELTYRAKQVSASTANVMTPYVTAGLIYLVFTIPLTRYAQKLEGRFSKGA